MIPVSRRIDSLHKFLEEDTVGTRFKTTLTEREFLNSTPNYQQGSLRNSKNFLGNLEQQKQKRQHKKSKGQFEDFFVEKQSEKKKAANGSYRRSVQRRRKKTKNLSSQYQYGNKTYGPKSRKNMRSKSGWDISKGKSIDPENQAILEGYKRRYNQRKPSSNKKKGIIQSLIQNRVPFESPSSSNKGRFDESHNFQNQRRTSKEKPIQLRKSHQIIKSISQAKKEFELKMKKGEGGSRWRGQGSLKPRQIKRAANRMEAKSSNRRVARRAKNKAVMTMYSKVGLLLLFTLQNISFLYESLEPFNHI